MTTETLEKILGYAFGIAIGVGLSFLFNWVVMLVWNWLMPKFFSLPTLSFWETYGFVFLLGVIVSILRPKKK